MRDIPTVSTVEDGFVRPETSYELSNTAMLGGFLPQGVPSMNPESATILLVEDNDGHAHLVQDNLRRAGITNSIRRVGDGWEALQFLDPAAPHPDRNSDSLVMILDLGLPRVDGFEVLRSTRANPRYQHMPIIILTTSENPDDIQRCYELGCDSCVSKWAVFSNFESFAQSLRGLLALSETP